MVSKGGKVEQKISLVSDLNWPLSLQHQQLIEFVKWKMESFQKETVVG